MTRACRRRALAGAARAGRARRCAARCSRSAAPLTPERDRRELCAGAEDPAHCGRLIEDAQLKRLPEPRASATATRLRVSLFPSGSATFTRHRSTRQRRATYSLWDYSTGSTRSCSSRPTATTRASRCCSARPAAGPSCPPSRRSSPDRQRLVDRRFLRQRLRQRGRGLARHARRRAQGARVEAGGALVRCRRDVEGRRDAARSSTRSAGDDKPRTLERRLDAIRTGKRVDARRAMTADADDAAPRAPAPADPQLRAAPGADVAGAAARAATTLLPRFGVPYRAGAARLRRASFGRRAPRRARDRLRHGRDDGGDRRSAARTSTSSASKCTRPGVGALLQAHRRARRSPTCASIRHDAVEVVDDDDRAGVARRHPRLLPRSVAEEAPSQAAAAAARVRARARAAPRARRLPARRRPTGRTTRRRSSRRSPPSRCS